MRHSYSLRHRLLMWLLGPLLIIGALALVDAYYSARQTANEVFDRVLSGSALAIAERIFVNQNGRIDVDIPYVALEMLTSAAQDRVFYRIDGPQNEFITGYKNLAVPETQETENRFSFSDGLFRKTPIRIAILKGAVSTGNQSVSYKVAIAETTNARDLLTQKIILRTAARLSLLIFIAAIIVWFAVSFALRPLKRLEEAIGRRTSDDLRPILHQVPREVNGLIETINQFMNRLGNALTALKHFSGNASHQIRTPLTIIKTQLALAQRSGSLKEAKAALEACDEAVGDAERTLSQLLLLARIDGEASKDLTKSTVNLTDIARNVCENHVLEADKSGFDLGFEAEEEIYCYGDKILLRELMRNLIDNSIKHASGGDQINLRVRSLDQSAILEVEDNGLGMQESQMQKVMQGEAPLRQSGKRETGLGLPIVMEIARLFSARTRLSSATGNKGLLVQIHFKKANQSG